MPSSAARNSLALKIEAAHLNVNGVEAYLTSRGVTPESAADFMLGCDPASGRLTIPYLTPAGPWQIKYRCVTDHDCKDHGHGKYSYDTGSAIHLFNAQALVTADTVVVVEGELDAISVSQLGLTAVAYPGIAMWKANPHWRWCFDSLQQVVVVSDGDKPGREAAAHVASSLRSTVDADVRLVDLPDGEDSNSYINQHGETPYLERLDLL